MTALKIAFEMNGDLDEITVLQRGATHGFATTRVMTWQ
jgi:hypothetical protein